MGKFDGILESTAESLYGDERLRSNLTDDQAKVVLDWAMARVTARVNAAADEAGARLAAQSGVSSVRAVLETINTLAKQSPPPALTEMLAAVDSSLPRDKPLTREQVLTVLSTRPKPGGQVRKDKGKAP